MSLADIARSTDYRLEQRELRVRRTRIGCMLTLTLVPLGSLLDLAGYPEQFWSIFTARMLNDVFLIPILILLYTDFGKRHIVWLSTLWAFSPVVTIAWMIYVTEGSASPFYAGLNLGVIGTCILLPYGLWESLLYCLGVIAIYVVACAAHAATPFSPPLFVNNVLFIFMTSSICVTACYFYSWARVRDYLLRHELKERNDQLQQLDEMKSRFFANVSHELRTPLTLLIAPVRHVLDTHPELQSDVTDSLGLVERNALRLLRLINDLLDLVRFDTGRPQQEKSLLDVGELLRELVETTTPLALQQRVRLVLEGDKSNCFILGDPQQLEKVFLNLLVNAVKFTEAEGEVRVSLARDGGALTIDVSDTGIGIAAADLPVIFERFRQADHSLVRKHQGLGVGLALAKEIVLAHGGEIAAHSEPGKGSRFTVTLPAASPPGEALVASAPTDYMSDLHREAARTVVAGAAHEAAEPTLKAARLRVLIADDEPDIREFLVSVLSRDYNVAQAVDGESALELIAADPPAVLIVDMMMPGISGLDVCRQLAAMPAAVDTKVLMLTARMDEQLKIDAINAGADDFLNKPFSTAEIMARVRTLSDAASLQQSLRERTEQLEQAFRELKAAETRLVQSEKMHAIGSLAAGLLHEFNNPLNHTLMAVEVGRQLLDRLRREASTQLNGALRHVDGMQETFDDVQGGLERIGGIISDLHTFAHPESLDLRKPFSLRQVIDTSIKFVASDLRDVEVNVSVPEDLAVIGAPSHITQVFVNMLLNAAAATKATAAERAPRISVTAVPHEEEVVIQISDNGTGMTEQVRQRIFDPFFTTKDVGEGTGLGLSICHTILKQHGSEIEVRSTPGESTTFEFKLAGALQGAE
jgi:signal transduction histidine kinase